MAVSSKPMVHRIFRWEDRERHGRSLGKGYVLDTAGNAWFTKGLRGADLTAEWVGSSIALALKLPIPEFGVAETSTPPPPKWAEVPHGYTRWLSRLVPFTAAWDNAALDRIVNLDDLGRVLAVDAVLHVPDRHDRNVLLVPGPSETYQLMVIDFDASAIGDPETYWDLAEGSVIPDPNRLLVNGLLLRDPIVESALALAQQATEHVAAFDDVVDEGCALGGRSGQGETLKRALNLRLAGAVKLVERYLEAVRRRQP